MIKVKLPSNTFFNSFGDEASFYKSIKKNKTDFFRQEAAVASTDKKKQVLKNDCNLFSQFFISCQARECDLSEFFRHENQSFPAALSDTGNLYPGKKSDLVGILEDAIALPDSRPECDVIIIDGAALVHSLSRQRPQRQLRNILCSPRCSAKTFELLIDV